MEQIVIWFSFIFVIYFLLYKAYYLIFIIFLSILYFYQNVCFVGDNVYTRLRFTKYFCILISINCSIMHGSLSIYFCRLLMIVRSYSYTHKRYFQIFLFIMYDSVLLFSNTVSLPSTNSLSFVTIGVAFTILILRVTTTAIAFSTTPSMPCVPNSSITGTIIRRCTAYTTLSSSRIIRRTIFIIKATNAATF